MSDAHWTYFFRVMVTLRRTGGVKKAVARERHEIQSRSRKDAIRCALETCSEEIDSIRVTLLRDATDEENIVFAQAMMGGGE